MRSAAYHVLYVPAGFEIDETDWERTRQRWDLDGEGWETGRVARALGAACASLGTPYLDLTAGLRASQRSGERAYFRDHPHWNEVGHRVAAAVLADAIAQTPCPLSRHASRH